MTTERMEKFEKRRAELRKLSDDELKKLFWDLCDKAVEPLVELSKTHTSPSIERSVLHRMGVNSIAATSVVARIEEAGLLGKGAGNCVLKVMQKDGLSVTQAAEKISQDPEVLKGLF